MKRAVPLANEIAIFDLEGFGSKTYSSMTRDECSVRRTVLSSKKVASNLPSDVLRSSLSNRLKFRLASYGS